MRSALQDERTGRDVELSRELGVGDATLIVMGGVIGSGIFATPSVVASRLHDARLIFAVWCFGGAITLIGAYIFAELAARRPASGGLYGYLRDAYHPAVAFMYGWTALLVAQSGGIAAAAITLGMYVSPLFPGHPPVPACALAAIVALSVVNCFGVRPGSKAQNAVMILKIGAIVAFIAVGLSIASQTTHAFAGIDAPVVSAPLLALVGTALIPIFFAYSGFQTAAFVDGEVRTAGRILPTALVRGVAAVAILYLGTVFVELRVLGAPGLAATTTPVSAIVRVAFGGLARRIVAIVIAVSLFGFLSNQILASPRIYYAMAKDRVFFRKLAWLHPRTRVPVYAIALQGVVACVIAVSGRYEEILNDVTSISALFLSLAAGAVFIFRKRAPATIAVRIPGHPLSTILFLAVSLAVDAATALAFPRDTLAGFVLLVTAIPAYFIFRRFESAGATT